jgi:hypothetical protein
VTIARRLRGIPATAGAALVASAILTIVLAAQAVLACTKKIAITLPGIASTDTRGGMAMPGMHMAGMHMAGMDAAGMATPGMPGMPMLGTVMICPVVLALGAMSFALTVFAVLRCVRDPHRALAGRSLVHAAAGLPVGPAAMLLAFLGAGGVGAMIAVDGNVPATLGAWAALGAMIFTTALILTFVAVLVSRAVIALRAGVAIVMAVLCAVPPRAVPVRGDRVRFARARRHNVILLAEGRGLRAPPLTAG